jgi:hypothetical protein
MTKEELELVINDPSVSQEVKDDAKIQLDKIVALETREQSEGVDDDVLFAVKSIRAIIDSKIVDHNVQCNERAFYHAKRMDNQVHY